MGSEMPNWKVYLKGDPVPWLLSSNPWTRYATMVNLMENSFSDAEVCQAKKELLQHPLIRNLLKEASDWLPKAATRNSDPKLSYFQLRMLADFGLDINDVGIVPIIEKAKSHRMEGLFSVRGGTLDRRGEGNSHEPSDSCADIWHASPCNSPVITNALQKLKYREESVILAEETLRDRWDTPQGWFCHFFFVDGQYKKLQASCPMAGVMALEVFSEIPELKESRYAQNAFEPILFHRNYGQTLYYFGRSRKFWTMKYPYVWYNALYLADVLTRFDFLKGNDLVKDLIDWVLACQDENGRFKATSVYLTYKEWDFGNKKEPSPWITYLCCKLLKQWFGV